MAPRLADNRLPSIDCFRGIAALGVMFLHIYWQYWLMPGEFLRLHPLFSLDPLGWISAPFQVMWLGGYGVPLFFVLSGYCIHRSQARALAADESFRFSLPRYALRRILRIYPTYVAALALSGVLRYLLMPWLETKGFSISPFNQQQHHSWYELGMNLLALQNIAAAPYESVYWTLSLEIHFYIVYPILLWITRRFGPVEMLCFATFFNIMHLIMGGFFDDVPAAHLGILITLFMRFWFLWTVGSYVAEMETGRAPRIPRPLLVAFITGILSVGIFVLSEFYPIKGFEYDPYIHFPLAICLGAILFWSLQPHTLPIWRSIPGRSLAFVGMFSYSLYAIHYPLLRVVSTLWPQQYSLVFASLLVGCILALLSFLFFLLVERWTLNPPRWVTGKVSESRAPVAASPTGREYALDKAKACFNGFVNNCHKYWKCHKLHVCEYTSGDSKVASPPSRT
jgi:peptidoglycan/LPS O-acetylase OafA/YrhL